MITGGFIRNLAGKTLGIQPPVAIRPAISPDTLPDAFSSVESIQPPTPSVHKMEPTKHESTEQVSPSPPKHIGGETPSATKPPGKPLETLRKDSDLDITVDTERSTPTMPVGIRRAEPASQPKLHRPGKIENNREVVDEKRDTSLHAPALPHDVSIESAPTSMDSDKTSKESRQEAETETAIPETPTATKKLKNPIAQPESESSSNTSAFKPSANDTEEQTDTTDAEYTQRTDFIYHTDTGIVEKHVNEITSPNTPKTGFVRQKHAARQQARQRESQTYRQDEDTVTINIGRIEVRAVFPEKQATPVKEQQNTLSLSKYLKLRAEGKL